MTEKHRLGQALTKNVKVVEGKNLYDGKAQAWSGTY